MEKIIAALLLAFGLALPFAPAQAGFDPPAITEIQLADASLLIISTPNGAPPTWGERCWSGCDQSLDNWNAIEIDDTGAAAFELRSTQLGQAGLQVTRWHHSERPKYIDH